MTPKMRLIVLLALLAVTQQVALLAQTGAGPTAGPDGTGVPRAPKPVKQALLEEPAPEAVNRQLPSWLKLSGEFRLRTETRTAFGYQEGDDDGYALFRSRLNIDVRPTSWMQFFVQGQDSRVAGIEPQRVGPLFKDPLDVRQAYVRFQSPDSKGWALTAGRQLLMFGDQRLVGALDWTNTSRSFDAIRLEWTGENARADFISASVVQIDASLRINHRRDGENLHGVYSSFKKVIPRSVIEPYVFLKTAPRVLGETGRIGGLDRYTGGVRVHSAPGAKLSGFDYNAAVVGQWGSFAGGDISAAASYVTLGYTLADAGWNPRLSAEFNYASGDDDPNNGDIGYFDDLYPTAHLYYGLTDLVGWRNIKNLRLGVDVKPHAKLKLVFDYHWFWLADRHDNLYNTGGRVTVRSPAGGALHTDVGQEADLTAVYSLSKQLAVGAGLGHMFPGRFLEENSPGGDSSFAYLFFNFKF